MTDEIHISSVVVRVLPASAAELAKLISIVPGAEVVNRDATRLVVVIECDSTGHTLDVLDAIRALPGVYSAELAYQHAEDAASMRENLQ